jgi:hypothetical protein
MPKPNRVAALKPYLPAIGQLIEAFLGNYNISICTIILSVKERDG